MATMWHSSPSMLLAHWPYSLSEKQNPSLKGSLGRSGQGISPPDGTDPESADMNQTYCLSLPAPLQPPKNNHHKMSIKTWSLLSLCPKKAKELAKGRDLLLLTPNPGNAVSATG